MRLGRHIRDRIGMIAFVGALLVSGSAFAQSRPPVPTDPRPPVATLPMPAAPVAGPVSVEVRCIRGTNANSTIDPELKELSRTLAYTRYTGFDLIDTHSDALAIGDEAIFPIQGGRKLKIQLIDRDETAARLRLRLVGADGSYQLDTTVRIQRNKTFMVMGPHLGDDVLILPVTARY